MDNFQHRSLRLNGFDYAEERAYFVTICAHSRSSLFGEVVEDTVCLSAIGEIARDCWLAIPAHFPSIELDSFVIMPDHMHGILVIQPNDNVGARHAVPTQRSPQTDGARHAVPLHEQSPLDVDGARHAVPLHEQSRPVAKFGKPQPRSPGTIIGSYKSAVTKHVNDLRHTPGATVWQRNYHDHIIRNEYDLNLIRAYIENNPARWIGDRKDSLNPPVWNVNP